MKVFIKNPKGEVLKRCSHCLKYKKMDCYHKASHSPSGVQSQCKDCRNASRRQYKPGYKDAADRFWKFLHSHTVRNGDCLEWTGRLLGGYACYKWKGKPSLAARIVYGLAVAEIGEDQFIDRVCNNRKCVRQSHLRLVSKEIIEIKRINALKVGDDHYFRKHPEKVLRGDDHYFRKHPEKVLRGDDHYLRRNPEKARGENNSSAKLTGDNVSHIRRLHSEGSKQSEIALIFGVSLSAIHLIVHRKNWKHVD